MPVKINGSTSGSVTLAAPATGSDVTLTLPTTALATQAYADAAADAAEIDAIAGGGLVLVSPTSIANSGGSASSSNGTTTFSGVSSISLNGVFSATYQNYRIIVNVAPSGVGTFQMRFRSSGSDNTSTNYKSNGIYSVWNTSTVNVTNYDSQSYWALHYFSGTTRQGRAIEVLAPFLSTEKTFSSLGANTDAGSTYSGYFSATNSFDGFTLLPPAGVTITGTVRVYGYKGA